MRPSGSSPESSRAMMFLWPIDEAERASCSKRLTASWFETISWRRSLSATSLASRMWRAAYTSPMPPSPSLRSTWYRPSRTWPIIGSSGAACCGPDPEGVSPEFIAPQYGPGLAACSTDPGPYGALRDLAGSGTDLGGIRGVRVVEDAHLALGTGRGVGRPAQDARGVAVVRVHRRGDELAGAAEAARDGSRVAHVHAGAGGSRRTLEAVVVLVLGAGRNRGVGAAAGAATAVGRDLHTVVVAVALGG